MDHSVLPRALCRATDGHGVCVVAAMHGRAPAVPSIWQARGNRIDAARCSFRRADRTDLFSAVGGGAAECLVRLATSTPGVADCDRRSWIICIENGLHAVTA